MVNLVFVRPRAPGLAEVLQETAPLSDAIQALDVAPGCELHLLPTGTLPSHPAELLSSTRMRALLERLSAEYGLIIFDTPPVNAVADSSLLSTISEGVLVVARAGVTTPETLAVAMEQLGHVRAPIVGAVLNDVDLERDSTYLGAYRYFAHDPVRAAPDGSHEGSHAASGASQPSS
jgi:capsular exopolysaccharide synthesis family protein